MASKSGPRGERGFTLIELLITVAVIGILSAIAMVNFRNSLDRGRQMQSMTNMRNLATALEGYQTDYSYLPANGISAEELNTVLKGRLFTDPGTLDGWRHGIEYTAGPKHYTLRSYGRDGVLGPEDISAATRNQFENDLVLCDGIFTSSPQR